MRFFMGFMSLLFICCGAEKSEKEALLSCEAGIDSLLRHSQVKYYSSEHALGVGYIDGHCLDSGKSLLLYQDRFIQAFEYGNFKKGHYAVDSVILPLFGFEAFKNRQQIVLRDLNWADDSNPLYEYMRFERSEGFFSSIQPCKDKIFGITRWDVIAMDVQKKSLERLVHYYYFGLYTSKMSPHAPKMLQSPKSLGLIRMRNDTLAAFRRHPDEGFTDTVLITLDGNNVVPKIRDDLCLKITLNNGERKRAGDAERCFGSW